MKIDSGSLVIYSNNSFEIVTEANLKESAAIFFFREDIVRGKAPNTSYTNVFCKIYKKGLKIYEKKLKIP